MVTVLTAQGMPILSLFFVFRLSRPRTSEKKGDLTYLAVVTVQGKAGFKDVI